ncbi:hypothetical protein AVEN_15131-1 [Araneus ventricosus]|uniref:Uncharacterized protein n=1 Tax=Araneus ventricosus TaxID=182803 RepID=A0A4Y2TSU7_ARAVE|nr:hypothetical protein AVEN_15131-1 [Araneus ventricosus]
MRVFTGSGSPLQPHSSSSTYLLQLQWLTITSRPRRYSHWYIILTGESRPWISRTAYRLDPNLCDFFPWCYLKSKVYHLGGVSALTTLRTTYYGLSVHGERQVTFGCGEYLYRMH